LTRKQVSENVNKPIEYFGGEKIFLVQKERDIRKKKLCKENKIKLLYYSNIKYNKSIIIDKKILLNTIIEVQNI